MRLASFFIVAVALVGCEPASGSQVVFKSDKAEASPADGDRTCTTGACTTGGDLTFCLTTTSDGTCTKAEYTHDGETFTCAACDDCTAAAQDAMQACGNAPSSSSSSGGSSSSSSSSSSSGGSSSGSTPTTSCQPVNATCVGGGQMQTCVTSSASTGCTNITYKYGGQSFSCNGCSSCTDVYYEAYTLCQDAVGACDDLASCCAQMSSSYQSSCNSTLSSYRGQSYGDISCKSALQSYRQQNLCP